MNKQREQRLRDRWERKKDKRSSRPYRPKEVVVVVVNVGSGVLYFGADGTARNIDIPIQVDPNKCQAMCVGRDGTINHSPVIVGKVKSVSYMDYIGVCENHIDNYLYGHYTQKVILNEGYHYQTEADVRFERLKDINETLNGKVEITRLKKKSPRWAVR